MQGVYFITDGNSGVKIGRAQNIKNRMFAIDGSSPVPVFIEGVVTCEDKDLADCEHWFHDKFCNKRYHKEWFHLDTELENWIFNNIILADSLFDIDKISKIPLAVEDYNTDSDIPNVSWEQILKQDTGQFSKEFYHRLDICNQLVEKAKMYAPLLIEEFSKYMNRLSGDVQE